MQIIDSIFPVFFLILLGSLAKRNAFLTANTIIEINRFLYWIAIPALLFYKISQVNFDIRQISNLVLAFIATTLACVGIGFLIAKISRIPKESVGSFVQAGYRGNLAFIGLPVILFSFPKESVQNTHASAVIILAPMIIVYNVIAISVLSSSNSAFKNSNKFVELPLQIFKNPLIISCIIGGLFSFLSLTPPLIVLRIIKPLGEVVLAMTLICVGANLKLNIKDKDLKFSVLAALIKTALAPVLGLVFSHLLEISPGDTKMLLIYLSVPTASAAYIMATQLKGNPTLTANTILLSVFFSFITLSIVIAY